LHISFRLSDFCHKPSLDGKPPTTNVVAVPFTPRVVTPQKSWRLLSDCQRVRERESVVVAPSGIQSSTIHRPLVDNYTVPSIDAPITHCTHCTHTHTHTQSPIITIMKLHDATDGCCNFFGFFSNNKDRLVQPPQTPAPDWAELESELTQDLTRMRIEDRERVLEDLHGIANVADEDPALVERALHELEVELERKKRGTSYELAQSLNREYVTHRKLRLQFLRADDMDPKAAADRLIKFFDNKRHLFGIDLLTKDIRRQDLDEYDLQALFSGMSQIAPEKDRAGRPIIVFIPALGLYHSMENMVGKFGVVGRMCVYYSSQESRHDRYRLVRCCKKVGVRQF
jgi:hypothetical protein